MTSIKEKLVSLLPLLLVSLVCVIVLYIVNQFTKETIRDNQQRAAIAIFKEVLPPGYDNDIYSDQKTITVPDYISKNGTIKLYPAKKNNETIALALAPVTNKGYGGIIKLAVGIHADGSLYGIRILEHHETDGFGDQAHQEKSDWLLQFVGHQYLEKNETDWAIKKDDGIYDQLSGATITSRSIIKSISQVLQFYSENRDTLLR